MAREQELDLVEVAPLANPPVCRIMNYGKYRYEEAQRAKESRRKSTNISIKEMKYRPKIGQGDFDTKTRKIAEFLGEGHKVKVTIMFRGREMQHQELGLKILDRVAEAVNNVAKIEASAKVDGRNMVMVLAPDKKKSPPKPAAAGRPAASAERESGPVEPTEAAPVEATAVEPTPPEPTPPEPTPPEPPAPEA
jgi:translation initiation factor IF-3